MELARLSMKIAVLFSPKKPISGLVKIHLAFNVTVQADMVRMCETEL